MKTFLLIFIFSLSLKADTFYNYKCVKDFNVFKVGVSSGISLTYSDNTTQTISYSDTTLSFLIAGVDKFEVSTYKVGASNVISCKSKTKNNTLGMTNEEYNFMMALTGLLSSILLVSIIFKKV